MNISTCDIVDFFFLFGTDYIGAIGIGFHVLKQSFSLGNGCFPLLRDDVCGRFIKLLNKTAFPSAPELSFYRVPKQKSNAKGGYTRMQLMSCGQMRRLSSLQPHLGQL